jgi:uncharacterized protein
MELFRQGTFIKVKFFDEGSRQLAAGFSRTRTPLCGAARGTVLVDVRGDMWPCHRWCKDDESEWKLGSIYEGGFNYEKRQYIDSLRYKGEQETYCRDCPADFLCAGGCPAENLEDTGSIWKKHPHGCEISRRMAELVTEFHDTLLAEGNPTFVDAYYADQQDRADERKTSTS